MRESTEKKLFCLSIIISYILVYVFVTLNPSINGFNIQRFFTGIAIIGLLIFLWNFAEIVRLEHIMNTILLLSLVGVVLSGIMTYSHYNSTEGFCPVSADGEIPCDIVNKSIYAEIMGFPVAILGILGYLFIFLFGTILKNKVLYSQKITVVQKYKHRLESIFVTVILLAIFFTLWLNYVQFVLLKTLCLECEFSAITITMLFLLSLMVWRRK